MRDNVRVLHIVPDTCYLAGYEFHGSTIEPLAVAAPYWRRIGLEGRLLSAPYFVPDSLLSGMPQVSGVRRNSLVCVTSSYPGPLIYDMVRNFYDAVADLGCALPQWEFEIMGKPLDDLECAPNPRIRHLGIVPNPLGVLRGCKALAVLSDYGRGFKTKILDAIICGAWVIVTPRLFRRLPSAVQRYCIVVDPASRGALAAALVDVEQSTWLDGDPNSILRAESYSAMDAAFLQ